METICLVANGNGKEFNFKWLMKSCPEVPSKLKMGVQGIEIIEWQGSQPNWFWKSLSQIKISVNVLKNQRKKLETPLNSQSIVKFWAKGLRRAQSTS